LATACATLNLSLKSERGGIEFETKIVNLKIAKMNFGIAKILGGKDRKARMEILGSDPLVTSNLALVNFKFNLG
jgi:hypothetical protein